MQHPLSVFGAGFSHMCCAEVRRTLGRLPLHAICGSRIRRRPRKLPRPRPGVLLWAGLACRKRLAVLPAGGTVSSAKSVQSSLLNALSGGWAGSWSCVSKSALQEGHGSGGHRKDFAAWVARWAQPAKPRCSSLTFRARAAKASASKQKETGSRPQWKSTILLASKEG